MGLSVTVLGCSGTYAGSGEACSGYLVRSPGATVAVDLGPGTLANLQRHVAIADLDALVLSHEHPDHWLDLPLLRNAMRYVLGLRDLPVHGTAENLAAARRLLGDLGPTLRWTATDAASVVRVGDLVLRFGRTDHSVPTLAVRVEGDGRALLYTADTGPAWEPGGLGAGVDLLLCEATLTPDEEGHVPHLSGRQAGALGRAMGAPRLVLTHLAPGVDDEAQRADAAAAYGGPVELAATHATIEV